jgi:hypothetical protein
MLGTRANWGPSDLGRPFSLSPKIVEVPVLLAFLAFFRYEKYGWT